MAVRIKESAMGDFTGKVGNSVMVVWRDLFVIKATPSSHRRTASAKKKAPYKAKFKCVMDFLCGADADKVFNMGFQLPKKSRMTALNAATSYHLLNAIEGEFPDYEINLAKVKFSQPRVILESGYKGMVECGKDFYVALRWELNPFPDKSTQYDDKAIIISYNKTMDNFEVQDDCIRRDALGFNFSRNLGRAGDDIFTWLFFISDDKKRVSETQYLGQITLMA